MKKISNIFNSLILNKQQINEIEAMFTCQKVWFIYQYYKTYLNASGHVKVSTHLIGTGTHKNVQY